MCPDYGSLLASASCYGPLEGVAPIEIVCRKEGFLDYRHTFAVARSNDAEQEQKLVRDLTPNEKALAAASGVEAILLLGGPVGAPVSIPLALVLMSATKDMPRHYPFAYPSLPEVLLTQASFDSEAACDAYFAAQIARLEAVAAAQRAHIDAQCRFWPCTPSDPAPCPDPFCQQRRIRVDTYLKSQLDGIAAQRAQVRIVAP